MATEEPSRLAKLLLYSIVILILLVATLIIHLVKWGPSFSLFINKTMLITWASVLLVSVIAAPYFIQKADFVPLILGIAFAALSGLIIGFTSDPLFNNIETIVTHPALSPLNLTLYLVLIAMYIVCIVLSILVLIRGINLIRDYSRKSA